MLTMTKRVAAKKPSGTPLKPIVFCDFDGTITQLDVTDLILSQLAHPSWQEVEQEWVRGLIGSRECLERQMALVETSAEQLDKLIDSVPFDPHFAKFYRFVQKRGLPFFLLSDGFDYVIRRVLKRAGIDGGLRGGVNVFASSLHIVGQRLVTTFPYAGPPCEHECATCKAAILRQFGRGRNPVIYIGDGFSDRFAVQESTLIFAKRPLAAYCREHGIACHPFKTFAEVEEALDGLRSRAAAGRVRQAAATERRKEPQVRI